jgi:hypothetical protein
MLQAKSLLVTSVRGLLLAGRRTQVLPCWGCQHHDIGWKREKGGTYIIGSVNPELLERGMAGDFLGSECCQCGGEDGPHGGGVLLDFEITKTSKGRTGTQDLRKT